GLIGINRSVGNHVRMYNISVKGNRQEGQRTLSIGTLYMELMGGKEHHLSLLHLVGQPIHLADHVALVHISELPEGMLFSPEIKLPVLLLIQNRIERLDVDIRDEARTSQHIGGGGDDLGRPAVNAVAEIAV